MEVKLPVKNLVRINFLLSLVMSGYVFVFLFLDKNQNNRFLFTLMTFLVISLIGFANILIVIRLRRIFGNNIKKFKRYRYLFTYLVSALAYLIIWPIFATLGHQKWSFLDGFNFFMLFCSSAVVNTLILVLHNHILLKDEKAQSDLELSKIKAAHAEAANLLLRQQIQPHFLFNALNMLKSLYRINTDTGDTYMVHLANFLRASTFNHGANVSKLGDELKILNDYLEMQKIRFELALNCTIMIPDESLNSFYLPSFSLQPLLENAIKHNELTEEMPLHVWISQEGDRVVVTNNLQKKKISEISTNNGLANLAERYRLWSGDEVIIKESQHQFLVSIKLLENGYSDH
ncbi:sensor histidine kinase [Pedobacter metabolipauper]|uniref:Histidine kinase n=1 Tax=Pedobacter metabolipauper TaxID=425513 RepID=A0A4R6SXR5_9SPHI|nr:histidine kinase [Pedobacter metabolipauper]TDQ11186.1 histidine kinase [Pedobacter metabolipauper]